MQALLVLLLLASAIGPPPPGPTTYTSHKSLSELQECLTRRLSPSGDVTAIQAEGYVTLIYKDATHAPLVIDVAPPNIIIKTDVPNGAQKSIQSCL